MTNFTVAIQKQCQIFSPFLDKKVEISSDVFILSQGKVCDFVQEIMQTCELISQQNMAFYVEFYTQRLVQQFDTLKNVVDKHCQTEEIFIPRFKSKYRFAKNMNKLPAEKQLEEYQKILRALNDKLSWLVELGHQTRDEQRKDAIHTQIQETEYRRKKCIEKIRDIEDTI
ncbi:primosomal replication protein PriC [Ursidibacter arcticus]